MGDLRQNLLILVTFHALQAEGVREEFCIYECHESDSAPFYIDLLIFVYLAIIQVVGILLSFQTRKVKIPVLNDSKYVVAIIYISSIVLVVLALGTFSLRGYINVQTAISCGGIMLLATTFLALIFIPKVPYIAYLISRRTNLCYIRK